LHILQPSFEALNRSDTSIVQNLTLQSSDSVPFASRRENLYRSGTWTCPSKGRNAGGAAPQEKHRRTLIFKYLDAISTPFSGPARMHEQGRVPIARTQPTLRGEPTVRGEPASDHAVTNRHRAKGKGCFVLT
jgi:hypothetical protein